MKKIILILAVTILFSSCATRKVHYSLTDVPDLSRHYFSNHNLTVKEFKDLREPDSTRFNFLSKGIIYQADAITKGGRKWYVNSNKYYQSHSVTSSVTKMIANQIKASHLFRSVALYDNAEPTKEFVLEGEIEKFDAYKESSAATKIGMNFGAVGALATLGVKTRYEAITVLTHIKLVDTQRNEIVWQGTVEGKMEGQDYADPYGWAVYDKASQSLKVAVNNLLRELAKLHLD